MNVWMVMLTIFVLAFGVGALAIFLEHLQKMAGIRAQMKEEQSHQMQHRLAELAQQVAELRQMHLDHALGIDSHIQHLDYRLSSLETRIEQLEQQRIHR